MKKFFDVGYDLTVFNGKIYLYCSKCKSNTEHKILGYYDDYTNEFIEYEKILFEKNKSLI